jgi:hypothetical protein
MHFVNVIGKVSQFAFQKFFRIFYGIIICCPASSELVAIVVETGAAISLSSEAD